MGRQELQDKIEFAKTSLSRNDSWIRFSDTKTGFFFAFTGLIIGLAARDFPQIKTAFSTGSCPQRTLIVLATFMAIFGICFLLVASLAAVFPRLKGSNAPTPLYFGSVNEFSYDRLVDEFSSIDNEAILKQFVSQIHATATIAQRKYDLNQKQLIGAVLVFLSWVISLLTQSLT